MSKAQAPSGRSGPRAPSRARTSQAGARVLSLDLRRIEKALGARVRYKYVHPRVEREGLGWKVVSPNCSRNIDAQGGDIDIAWLVPHSEGWLLFSRDHALDCWQLRHSGGTLDTVLARLCADPAREFWQ